MPQAPTYLCDEWEDDYKAIDFLQAAGYRLLRGWTWKLPSPNHIPTPQENRAINYLILEWDFGGIEGEP